MKGMFDPVSKRCVLKTAGKDTTMSVVIFSILFSVILLCALWFHDTWYPPEGRAESKHGSRSLHRVEGGNQPSSPGGALPQPSPVGKEAELAFPLLHQER